MMVIPFRILLMVFVGAAQINCSSRIPASFREVNYPANVLVFEKQLAKHCRMDTASDKNDVAKLLATWLSANQRGWKKREGTLPILPGRVSVQFDNVTVFFHDSAIFVKNNISTKKNVEREEIFVKNISRDDNSYAQLIKSVYLAVFSQCYRNGEAQDAQGDVSNSSN